MQNFEISSDDQIRSIEDVATIFWDLLENEEGYEDLIASTSDKKFNFRFIRKICSFKKKIEKELPSMNRVFRDLAEKKFYPVVAKELKESLGEHANTAKTLMNSYLGRGSFGIVYAVLDKKEKEKSIHKYKAVKCCELQRSYKKDNWKANTMSVLQKNPHKNILKLYKIWTSGDRLYLVTECCKGTLAAYLSHYVFKDLNVIKCVFYSIADGVRHLHKLEIWHNDLKLDNILITFHEIPKIRISDFDLARKLEPMMSTASCLEAQETLGCKTYQAPESKKEVIHKKDATFRGAYDHWAMGIILGELMVQSVIRNYGKWVNDNKPLYENKDVIKTLIDEVSAKKDPTLQRILQGLLKFEPTARMSAETVCMLLRNFKDEDKVTDTMLQYTRYRSCVDKIDCVIS
mmetsp:Transcript_2760/g.4002  ORF Transcript_2760/g.4002 Transcript_2760/m.4002 type:complete len:403 (-) Transcript_2760:90-1298(-)